MLMENPGGGYFEAADVVEVYPDTRNRSAQLIMRSGNVIEHPVSTSGNFNRLVGELVDEINENKCC